MGDATTSANLLQTIVTGLLGVMGYGLFLRWRNRLYLVFTICLATAALFYLVSVFSSGWIVRSYFISFVNAISIVLYQAAFFHIFKPKMLKQLFVIAGSGGVLLISAGLFPLLLGFRAAALLFGIFVVGMCLFFLLWAVPQLPKQSKFRTALLIGLLGSCLILGHAWFNVPFLFGASNYVFLAFNLILYCIFFDRIMDLMQAVSFSSVMDGLTGLFNKNYFKSKVGEAIAAEKKCGIIFIDIDNFKKLNDTQGHQVGDVMLKFTAQVLKEVCENAGFCGRYGGEEMVALITDPHSDIAELAEEFRTRVEEESKAITPITVSVGYCRFNRDVKGVDEFIKQADVAMYRSKTTGKNRISSFEDTQRAHEPAAADEVFLSESNEAYDSVVAVGSEDLHQDVIIDEPSKKSLGGTLKIKRNPFKEEEGT